MLKPQTHTLEHHYHANLRNYNKTLQCIFAFCSNYFVQITQSKFVFHLTEHLLIKLKKSKKIILNEKKHN